MQDINDIDEIASKRRQLQQQHQYRKKLNNTNKMAASMSRDIELQILTQNTETENKQHEEHEIQDDNSSSLRIMETVITEDTESTSNSPESLPFMPLSASTSFAANTESMLVIGDSFPFAHTVTVSTSAPEYVSVPLVPKPQSAATSPKGTANNKFTRKRERVCNNNSNIISRMPYFKAFSN